MTPKFIAKRIIAPGIVRFGRPSRTGFSQDNASPNIRQVPQSQVVHSAFDEQRLLPVYL